MVERIHLTSEERDLLQAINHGLRVKADQWIPARLGLAKSLQIPDAPDPSAYGELAKQARGVELHAPQLTGEGREGSQDLTDVLRALISVYEGRDLFSDEDAFHDSLQRHVRRGLRELVSGWPPEADFHRYLAQELFVGNAADGDGGRSSDEGLPDRVLTALGQLGIGATILSVDEGPRLTRFGLELKALDDLDRLRRGTSKIAFALGLGQDTVSFALAQGERRVSLFLPREPLSWRTVTWPELRPTLDREDAQAMELPVCLGTDVLGAPLLIDLAEAPHLFVGGTTGSGKSMCLHAILLSLLEGKPDTQLVLVDPKAVEFPAYDANPRVRGNVITSPDGALAGLEELVEEMERRQDAFRELGARNLAEANARRAGFRRIVAVVDELGDLFLTRREIELPLTRLAQKARSAGIHLVLATQRPEAATFPGLLRSNIPSRIALTVQKATESRIILDETGAENLLMRGDMLVKFAGQPTRRAHGCRIDPADILAATGHR